MKKEAQDVAHAMKGASTHPIPVIPEHRTAEDALCAREERYRSCINNAPVGVFILDEKLHVVAVNKAACTMLGAARQALLGRVVMDFLMPGDATEKGGRLEELKRVGRLRWEALLFREDGGKIHGVVDSVFPDDGPCVAYLMDETAQRRRQVQHQQAETAEAIRRLTAGMAHDLNNMLSPIVGYTELLMDDLPDGSDCHVYSQEIKGAAERLKRRVRQLLDFSCRKVPSLESLDVRQVVMGIEGLLGRSLGENTTLTLSLAGAPCPVQADIGQLEQALMCLTVNAREAMPHGGVLSIRVEPVKLDARTCLAHPVLAPGAYVRIDVEDTGTGMDASIAGKVFDPFFSTRGKGRAGLGLPMVHNIVVQHGGCVVMDSEGGRGTVFSLYLILDLSAARVR